MKYSLFAIFWAVFIVMGCSSTIPEPILFGPPYVVAVTGYKQSNLMEPFFTRDGKYLLFNNLNNPSENANLHWAVRKDDKTFEYKGEISGVATSFVEGTPSMD